MNAVWQDIRYSFRSLRKSPGFTCVAIITLGLGIGLNTAIYSIINAFLLRPLPVRDPQQLAVLATRDHHVEVPHGLSYRDYRDYQRLTGVFADVLARREFPFAATWKKEHRLERLWVSPVTTNYFGMLGVPAALGRTFEPDELRQPVAVLDYLCWRDKFGANAGILGQAISLDGHSATIIGVAPERFQGTQISMRPDLYVPLQAPGLNGAATPDRFEQRDAHEFRVIGRLRPDTTLAQARAAVNVLAAQLARQYPDTNKGVAVITIPERFSRPEPQVSESLPAIAVFSMAIVGLVLLIACVNIANLLLVRASTRGKEMALRAAIGGSRFRLVRLLLAESVLLAVFGGATGVVVANWAIRIMRSRPASIDLPVYMDWSPDGRVLFFTTIVALLTGIVCGLAPAWHVARPDLATALKEGTARATAQKRRLTSMLVAGQVGVSMLLLIVAGLFIRGAQIAQKVDLGFDRNNLQLLSVDLAKQGYDRTRGTAFLRELLDEIEAMPGVRGVSIAASLPFDLHGSEAVFSDEQIFGRRSDALTVLSNTVGPDYFRVMGIPVLQGRAFDKHDDESAPPEAVINEALAQRLWPGKNALHRIIRTAGGSLIQVIGVVKTGKYAFLNEEPRPYMYLAFRQNYTAPTIIHVRTAGPPALLVSSLRQAIRGMDPELPVFDVKTMQDHLRHGYVFSGIILGGALSGLLGMLGLALASIGLYGVVANTISQRTREIGIRTALGASRASILGLVLRQSLILVSAGTIGGIGSGLGASQLLKRVLFSVNATDPVTFVLMFVVLGVVATAACLIPARRATKVDPVAALRCE
ncbi:MAG TPA: ABC transporter permease [Tepidisphaeraceae bacterium]